MSKFRAHVKNVNNFKKTIAKLLKQYNFINLAIIDIFFQKIYRFNMNDFKLINEYVNYIQRHYNKILQANKTIDSWIFSICFRMRLSSYLNFYIFQLIYIVKDSDRELTIDEIIVALIEKQKRNNYNEEKTKLARVVKNRDENDEKARNSKNEDNINNKNKKKQDINEKNNNNREENSCQVKSCNSKFYNKNYCLYIYIN